MIRSTNCLRSDRCRKRKLKCDRDEGAISCHRCMKTGGPCSYAYSPTGVSITEAVPVLGNDIAALREQVQSLASQLKGLNQKLDMLVPTPSSPANPSQPSRRDYSVKTTSHQHEPQQPLFVGHTRSAFSLDVARTSLSQMGISPTTIGTTSGSPSPASSTGEASPEPDIDGNLIANPLSSVSDPLLAIPLTEVCRLIAVFHEEIEALYPFINSDELVAVASTKMTEFSKQMEITNPDSRTACDISEDRDINILKIAVAIAVVIEAKGKNPLSSKLIDSTDKKAAQVTRSPDVDLRDLQWLALMGSLGYSNAHLQDLLTNYSVGHILFSD
ncbi:hypothetical protein ANO14919_128910 [Xylariales sp. No.14919]|nr:hypothetical protein ANO14919_128910 [Xylariales sp. No.14919]